MRPKTPLYKPPYDPKPSGTVGTEYELREKYHGGMTLDEMYAGKHSKNRTIYPSALHKQDELMGRLVEGALVVALEEFLLRPEGVTAEQLLKLNIIKSETHRSASQDEIFSLLRTQLPDQAIRQEFRFNDAQAKQFVRTLCNKERLRNADDFVPPRVLQEYHEACGRFRNEWKLYAKNMQDPNAASKGYRAPERPKHPFAVFYNSPKREALRAFAQIEENGVKHYETAKNKVSRNQCKESDLHDVNRVMFIPATIRAYNRFCEWMKHELGEEGYYDRPICVRNTGLCDGKLLIPLTQGFSPTKDHPAKGSIAEIIIIDSSQHGAWKEGHDVFESFRKASEKKPTKQQAGRKELQVNSQRLNPAELEAFKTQYAFHMRYFHELNTKLNKDKQRANTPEHIRTNRSQFAVVLPVRDQDTDFETDEQIAQRLEELLILNQSIHAVAASRATEEWKQLYLFQAISMNHARKKEGKPVAIPETMLIDIDPTMHSQLLAQIQNEQHKSKSAQR